MVKKYQNYARVVSFEWKDMSREMNFNFFSPISAEFCEFVKKYPKNVIFLTILFRDQILQYVDLNRQLLSTKLL